ncbi:Uncharacterized protein PODLI_1B028497, partial [Podarcis lilfordi]
FCRLTFLRRFRLSRSKTSQLWRVALTEEKSECYGAKNTLNWCQILLTGPVAKHFIGLNQLR